MEQDWEYIAGRNQASRQYHKQKRKEAEEKLATLRAENERLRGKLEWIGMSSECQWTQAVAKEALK